MEAAGKVMNYSWAWLMSMLIFFCNTLPFAGGFTLSILLTPVWLYLLHEWKVMNKGIIIPIAIATLGYTGIHFINGAIPEYYIVSSCMLLATLCFGLVAFHTFRHFSEQLDAIFRNILILNFAFALLSIVLLFIPSLKNMVWYTISISQDIEPMPRLKLLTAEASHYSYLLAPLVIYFISRVMFFEVVHAGTTLMLVLLPLALSFSLGVLSCLVATGILMCALYGRKIFAGTERKRILLYTLLVIGTGFIALYFFYPTNPLYLRIANIFDGKDTSARGRTYESFILAHKIIAQKSFLFGIGPGQMKVFARDIIVQYYIYMKIPDVVRIPNACADTMVCYGYIGLVIRLGLQVFLFFKSKVSTNPFRVWLFFFLFLYQFTGSYINNAIEFLLWALVFAPVFHDMNHRHLKTELN